MARCGSAVDDGYLFVSTPEGALLRPDVVTSRDRASLARSSLVPTGSPTASTTFATGTSPSSLAAGIPAKQVAGRVRRASTKMTLDVYGRYLEPGDREAAEAAALALDPPKSGLAELPLTDRVQERR